MSSPEFKFRIRKDVILTDQPEDILNKVKVDVISVREKKVIMRGLSIMDVIGKFGGGPRQ